MLYQTKNQHGGDVYGGGITLDFSANTNPLGTPTGVLEAVCRALPRLHRYPDPYCRQLVQAISSRNITELCTRFADPVNAHVLVGIDIKNSDEVASVLEDLRAAGFSACDLTDNELAKLHLRHMVGGNAPQVHNERLIRFFFPERPGALLNFMDAMRVTSCVMATTLSAAQTTSCGPILSLPYSKMASTILSWCVKIRVGTGIISYFASISVSPLPALFGKKH
mgnify:CR=1 FL=1